jgi:hypothetical protein
MRGDIIRQQITKATAEAPAVVSGKVSVPVPAALPKVTDSIQQCYYNIRFSKQ